MVEVLGMRWPSWIVRTAVFGGLGLLLIIAIGGRVRADRALDRANEVAKSGTPGAVAARAQQAVSVWSGQPSVVVSVEKEQDHWRAVAMAGTNCYELAVDERVSSHPGLIPCPAVESAGTGNEIIEPHDIRRVTVELFLSAWLKGEATAERYMAADEPVLVLQEKAERVVVTGFYGNEAKTEPGSKSVVTAVATVTYEDRTEQLAWTLTLVLEGERWAVELVAGGEVPTGDSSSLTSGVSPVSWTTTTED
jgi:hypothetical protein